MTLVVLWVFISWFSFQIRKMPYKLNWSEDNFTVSRVYIIFSHLYFHFPPSAAYLNTGIILMNQGKTEEARRTFLKCSEIPDENLKDPHAHKSSVTSCLYNLGKLYHEQGHYEVRVKPLYPFPPPPCSDPDSVFSNLWQISLQGHWSIQKLLCLFVKRVLWWTSTENKNKNRKQQMNKQKNS